TIRRSAYFDSVALMRVAEQARQIPGVLEVTLVMGTPANRATLVASELWPVDAPATASEDLLIAVRAKSDDALRLALASVPPRLDRCGRRLGHRHPGGHDARPPPRRRNLPRDRHRRTRSRRRGRRRDHAPGTRLAGGRRWDPRDRDRVEAVVARRRRPRARRRGPNRETRRRLPPRLRRTDPNGPRGRDDAGGGGHRGCSTHRCRPARP